MKTNIYCIIQHVNDLHFKGCLIALSDQWREGFLQNPDLFREEGTDPRPLAKELGTEMQ